ncbi:hypothetical protein R5N98_03085 [Tenacibaculum maritimum]|uniref:Uncharacterized protein n=2 Tax=Tenacibaculum maritimum TaxID=107401 RepID=A0A2H1E9G7_9FLAO|nr:hypothetical protein [Tenacibaculum maritimum]CAA0144665.1 hypothetical protein TM902_180014 [Tenacibaculum maritimum]CAA0151207.1 hypothetical protein AQ1689_200002 [Tenacibaculum maritimum]CAA0154672.1 hypothetical protein AQ1685_200002 [Tenacibaculum maritimum]CAA0155205.1 hypothetical protein AQ1688_200006 [Tenacibaculum maritimum]CAA0170717.1 hypothetical protein JIP32914_140060 [Tenacibaculum maritimum]
MKKKIPGDKLLLLFSLVFLVISFIVLYGVYEKMKITNRGETIMVKIKEAPENCSSISSNNDGYCKLEYEDKTYVIRAGKKFCPLVSGKKKVEMLTNENKSRVIFLGEYNSSQYGSGLFIFLVALFAIYSSIKSIRSNND